MSEQVGSSAASGAAHNDRQAVAYPTDIPGLYDVVMSDGTVVGDMTIGQLRTMAFHGYPIRRASDAEVRDVR